MTHLAVAPAQRLIRDLTEQVLREGMLAALRRARIRLYGHDLLGHEPGQQILDAVACKLADGAQTHGSEGFAEHGSVLHKPSLLGDEAVEASRDQRMQCLGYFEGFQ